MEDESLELENESGEQANNSGELADMIIERRPWLFKPGQSGNPSGRPKGSISLKEYAKKMLREMTDEERAEFMKGLPKEFIWKMAEGMPDTKNDITTNGKDLPVPIINVQRNDSIS